MEKLLPIALGVIMLGLGLTLTTGDFRRVFVYPRAVFVGLVCQALLLPLACWGVARAFALPPELAVGLMLLAASPGGATANLFSHLAKGDVALNITLTATNSLLSIFTMPFILSLSIAHFMSAEQRIPLQFAKVLQVFAIVLIPVGIGMIVRAKNESVALRLEKPVRILSALFLVVVILGSVLAERAQLGEYFRQVGLAALTFNLLSMGVGYAVPRLLAVSERQAIAIGMEIGIHNGTLAMALATNVLANSVMRIPAAIYSLIMFFTAAAFGAWVARRVPDEQPAASNPSGT
jgi:BASS family bile acid:Na+ symporter